MYTEMIRTSCAGTTGTVNAKSFTAASPGGDPYKYILDYNSLLTCVQEYTHDSGITQHSAYSINSDDGIQTTLSARYRQPLNGITEPGQTDIFQVYLSLDTEDSDPTPIFLALNYAGANTVYSRSIVLINFVTHKFAAKFNMAGSRPEAVTAIGVGGVDIETGIANTGYFYTRFFEDNGTTESTVCIDNVTGDIQTDNSNCTTNSVPIGWTSSDDVKTYLGMTTVEATNLSSFLEKFTTEALLLETDSPDDAVTDPEQDFPNRIITQ